MSDSAKPGQVLGHYEIVRLLGRGGMGEVYEAEDRKLGRRVALKILPRELVSNPDRRTRFEREARTIAALKHPNIVTVHSIDETEGQPFLVMELVEGTPLQRKTPSSGMELSQFLEIAIQLSEAIGAAHIRGITHRDLKPGNIIVGDDNHVSVLDFGLAKWVEESTWDGDTLHASRHEDDADLTGEGQIVGTVAYMSPEQAEGKQIDHRSDVFSLGVVLYEMATGRRPFDGDSGMSLISSILKDDPDSVSDLRPAYPRRVARIIRRCLQKDPSRRYQTILDLRNDLLEVREDLDSGILELGTTGSRTAIQRGISKRAIWLTAAVLALILLSAAIFIWQRPTTTDQSQVKIRRLVTQGIPTDTEPALSPDGRYVAYQSSLGGIRTVRLLQVATGSDVELASNDAWDRSFRYLQFSRDGNYLYYTAGSAGEAATLWRVPTLGGVPERIMDRIIVGAAVSPDGKWVAAVRGDEINDPWTNLEVVSTVDRSVRSRKELDRQEFWSLAWSPDGEQLIVEIGPIGGSDGPALYTLSPDGGDPEILIASGVFGSYEQICPEAGRNSLLVSAARSADAPKIWRVDLGSGSAEMLHGDYNDHFGCSAAADGQLIVTMRSDVRAQLWIAAVDGKSEPVRVSTSSGSRDGAAGVTWLDDDTLVYGAPDDEDWQLWQVDLDNRSSRKLTSHGGVTPSAANGTVAYMGGWRDDRWGAYVLEPSGMPKLLSPVGVPVDAPSTLSSDGNWIFYQELVDAGMRLIRRSVDGEGSAQVVYDGTAHLAHFSPDGTKLNAHVLGEDGTWRTEIYPAGLGLPIASLDLHSEVSSPWASNDSIYIIRGDGGVRNVYEVNVETLAERRVTHFTEDTIFNFAVSPDLRRLAISRGNDANELLLIDLGGDE